MFLKRKPRLEEAPRGGISALNIEDAFVRYAPKEQDVLRGMSLDVKPGQFVSILGRSGAGKTTALRAVAGFERLRAGYIRIGGQLVSSSFAHIAPEKRRVGLVFQDYALFPNMKVEQNIAFASRSMTASQRRQAVDEAMEIAGVSLCRGRYPNELSGGQQQRVAFARALISRPELLLLDEPFSNVDSSIKAQLRGELLSTVKEFGITTIMVTHNREDALSLSDSVAIMCDGVVKQCGDPEDVYKFPCSSDVAALCGPCNFIEGVYSQGRASTGMGVFPARAAAAEPADGARVSLLIRPTDVGLRPSDAADGARIVATQFKGNTLEYGVRLPTGEQIKVIMLNSEMLPLGSVVDVAPRARQPLMAFAAS